MNKTIPTTFAATALAALAAQPVAAADCVALDAVFAAQESKFETLKGEVKQRGMMSYTYFPKSAPGVLGFTREDCGIRSSSSTVEYRCTISFPDLESMQAAYDAAKRDIGQCLIAKSSSTTSVAQQETGFVPANGASNNLTLGTRRGNGDTLVVYLSSTVLRR